MSDEQADGGEADFKCACGRSRCRQEYYNGEPLYGAHRVPMDAVVAVVPDGIRRSPGDERTAQMQQLRRAGLTYPQIGHLYGISETAVGGVLRAANRSPEEAARLALAKLERRLAAAEARVADLRSEVERRRRDLEPDQR